MVQQLVRVLCMLSGLGYGVSGVIVELRRRFLVASVISERALISNTFVKQVKQLLWIPD